MTPECAGEMRSRDALEGSGWVWNAPRNFASERDSFNHGKSQTPFTESRPSVNNYEVAVLDGPSFMMLGE
ncbi:hypothetical protein N7540_004440 [Penicillium herquei]|nr:hypothetical protein N7540_004440 [Penicillium herquei]